MKAYEILPDGEHFRRTSTFVWQLGTGHTVTIPNGYVFNISSPFCRRWITSHVARWDWCWLVWASCIHDYLIVMLGWSRFRAGTEFYRAMCHGGGLLRAIAVLPLGVAVTLWRCWVPNRRSTELQ
ncbi:hypothetical protein EDC90_104818 [Martelella mediterranea]|uniref:Uncharacterized protein n=1 Tax=Martelella mediterranea TaxID=293089 RepID=A0A4R3NDT2_9HYPH|nr:hypothetical protein EDC90_104818 [Martelella mediterranea]